MTQHRGNGGDGGYVHGTARAEQLRLVALNALTNPPFLAFLRIGPERANVLEVGCGLGILAAEVALAWPHAEVIGLERSSEQLAAALPPPPNLHLVQGDAEALPFARDTFDIVYCRYLLEHVPNPARVLSEMRRVLRPGGRVFVQENDVSVCRFDPPTPLFDRVWGRFAELQAQLGGDALIGRRLHSLLRHAGFVDVALSLAPELHWAGTPTFEPWVENIIGNVVGAAVQLTARGLASPREIADATAELRALLRRDDASALFHWHRATGRTR